MEAEPITLSAPRPVRHPALVQGWHELTFLHWPADPAAVAALLPAGTRPDTLDGVTYVGLVPFVVRRTRLASGPVVPYLGTFCETNVRLYSVDDEGRRGAFFLSMDAARLLPVLAGRLGVRLPYHWAAMRLRRRGDVITYACRRRGSGGPASRAEVRTGPRVAEPTPLERFLTGRWGLHVAWHGRTLYLPNDHEPWPLHRAELLRLDDGLIPAAGLPPVPGPPVSVLYSPGVTARFGTPLRVSRGPDRPGGRR
ncbi:DUF2071 domain-containing protein [Streptomyces sp. DH24]|uniref:YqjF family protein n=1 Tax=Streptomyces sp. DH24 TaxID=3040123 RepID=UPI0024436D47|nr:DUF2071 domain-containing protein [Streptomyces sp. DH24]MDG9717866.1 DUF2071 domain-containing protein [Streptomyces sp. DH24]